MTELEEVGKHMSGSIETLKGYLGDETDYLLGHICQKIQRESLYLPGRDFVDRVFCQTFNPLKFFSILLEPLNP